MAPKLTVIVPAHNCEKKIRKSVQSILNQDYRNLELILVENGSEDRTYNVCREFAQRDSRCIVLQSAVKSTLIARKTGIDYATGDFVTFCDADDYYKNCDSLNKMVVAAVATKADIIQFGNIINRLGKKTESLRVKNQLVIDRRQLLEEDIAGAMGGWNQRINLSVWSKIYRTKVLKSISKDLNLPLINAEDLYLNVCAYYSEETQHIAFVPLCEYVYNTGIGVSGDGIKSTEKMFREYQWFKSKAIELADKHGVTGKPVYLCHRETLRYLDNLIKLYIIRGDLKENVCERISEYWSFNSVQQARNYFREYIRDHDLDEEMRSFSLISVPSDYYDYCIHRLPKIKQERMKYKVKSMAKKGVRFLDQVLS